jgi:hypothetical protein
VVGGLAAWGYDFAANVFDALQLLLERSISPARHNSPWSSRGSSRIIAWLVAVEVVANLLLRPFDPTLPYDTGNRTALPSWPRILFVGCALAS